MSKKKIELVVDDLVEVKPQKKSPSIIKQEGPTDWEQLNIRVEAGVKKDFRGWCLRHDKTMGEALLEGYEFLVEKYGT
jgi:hypothetical protein